MPKVFTDYSDTRMQQWCVHCATSLQYLEQNGVSLNKDHVPSKSLLIKPYPADLTAMMICEPCNTSFSSDEEYVTAFLSAVLSGTTDPDSQKLKRGKNIFQRNEGLRRTIEASRDDDEDLLWLPDIKRFENVIVKNSRGHALFDGGEAQLTRPVGVYIKPIVSMASDELGEFFNGSNFAMWPEVGSRWMQRLVKGDNFDKHGFLVVQPNVYRYKVDLSEGFQIKTVLFEYLAASVLWE